MRARPLLSSALLLSPLAVPEVLLAQTPPVVVCTGLAGCGAGPDNIFLSGLLPGIVAVLASLAGGGAVIAVAGAGIQMLFSNGDESKITSGKWAIIYSSIGLTFVILSQRIVSYVISETYVSTPLGSADSLFGPGGLMSTVIRLILIAFNVTFVLVLMISGYQMAFGGGKTDQFERSMKTIKWAIAGAIVTNGAYAIVRAILNVTL